MADEKNIVVKLSGWIANNYRDYPTLRLLLPVVAAMTGVATGDVITGAIAAGTITSLAEGLSFTVSKSHQERFNTLIDEIEKQNIVLTEQIALSEEFIHSVLVITRASINTYQREKIKLFALLLINAIDKEELASDKFEEYTRILESITIRELKLLKLLYEYQQENSHQVVQQFDNNGNFVREYLENDMQRTNKFWEEFISTACMKLDFDAQIIPAILTGLNRTGLYETYAGMYLGYTGGIGKTTALFDEFATWIKSEADTDSILYSDD